MDFMQNLHSLYHNKQLTSPPVTTVSTQLSSEVEVSDILFPSGHIILCFCEKSSDKLLSPAKLQ
jgi:hypothetical protein